jgi:hypothetical protein
VDHLSESRRVSLVILVTGAAERPGTAVDAVPKGFRSASCAMTAAADRLFA